jgi:GGDEF domain-containing protein
MKPPIELASGKKLHVSLSIGGAIAQLADTRPESLLEVADQAMYRAKRTGPGKTEIDGFEPSDSGRDVG